MPNAPRSAGPRPDAHDPLDTSWYEIEVDLLIAQVELARIELGIAADGPTAPAERANLPEALARR